MAQSRAIVQEHVVWTTQSPWAGHDGRYWESGVKLKFNTMLDAPGPTITRVRHKETDCTGAHRNGAKRIELCELKIQTEPHAQEWT